MQYSIAPDYWQHFQLNVRREMIMTVFSCVLWKCNELAGQWKDNETCMYCLVISVLYYLSCYRYGPDFVYLIKEELCMHNLCWHKYYHFAIIPLTRPQPHRTLQREKYSAYFQAVSQPGNKAIAGKKVRKSMPDWKSCHAFKSWQSRGAWKVLIDSANCLQIIDRLTNKRICQLID